MNRLHNGKSLRLERLEDRLALTTTTAIADGSWLDPTNWDAGVPDAATDVVIPAGRTIQLDGASHAAATLNVAGTLEAVENAVVDKTLSAEWILVHGGVLQVGTEADRYDTNTLTITLEGDDPSAAFPSIGLTNNNAFVMPRAGGQLHLYGAERVSWTQLGATALRGATQITLKEPVDWQVGDEIVVSSTSYDMNDAAVRTITAINGGGTEISFTQPLLRNHFGELQTFDRGDGTVYTIDERAEVGLFTRTIKLQGDAEAGTDGIGGHVMVMPSAGSVEIDSVELYQMGQKGRLGRYPVHWHLAGDRDGDFIRNSSIHRSFNRVITIHAAHNILVEDNVAYDHIGSGFFLEDGVETGNKFYGNLGLLTREPVPMEALLPTDLGPKSFQISGPGTYWITNPDNEFVGNVAGGSESGSGFWYAMPSMPLNTSTNNPIYAGVVPREVALGRFEDNRAHSNAIGLDVDGGPDPVTQASVSTFYDPPVTAEFLRFTSFANDKVGVYFRGNNRLELVDARLANNNTGVMYAGGQKLTDSLVVGLTDNSFPGPRRDAYAIYDGPGFVTNTHFANYGGEDAHLLRIIGAANRTPNHRFEQVTYDGDWPFEFDETVRNETLSRHWGFSVYDVDGSLTGTPGHSVIYDHPMMRSDGDIVPSNADNAVISTRGFARLRLVHGLVASEQPTITVERTDGPGADATFTDVPQFEPFTQFGAIVNTDFVYTVNYDTPLASDQIRLQMTGELSADDYAFVRIALPWDNATIANATRMPTEAAVRAATEAAYYVNHCGEVFLKKFGAGDVLFDEAPGSLSVAIADFDSGVDPRGVLAQTQAGLRGTIAYLPNFQGEGVNHFDVNSNGNGVPGFVDYQLRLDEVEDWRGYGSLTIDFASSHNVPIQVFVREATLGFLPLNGGMKLNPGTHTLDLSGADQQRLDEVDRIHIRIQESDVEAAGVTSATTYLKSITASVETPDPALPGDFNDDGVVNALDYAVWRDALDSAYSSQVDHDADCRVGEGDRGVWADNYGSVAAPAAAALLQAPDAEPSSVAASDSVLSAPALLRSLDFTNTSWRNQLRGRGTAREVSIAVGTAGIDQAFLLLGQVKDQPADAERQSTIDPAGRNNDEPTGKESDRMATNETKIVSAWQAIDEFA